MKEKKLDTDDMIYMIEVLLGLGIEMEDSSIKIREYHLSNDLIINFIGNPYKVQLEVLRWLSSPPRLKNMKIMTRSNPLQ